MNTKIVYDFVNAINEHDIIKICSLMADDHKFIDAHGNEAIGKEKMKAGWTGYFQWFPDYNIEITEIFSNGDTLAAFGFASGTFKGRKTNNNENYWRLPVAWKAIVCGNKIELWQVYADTKIPFDIIDKTNESITYSIWVSAYGLISTDHFRKFLLHLILTNSFAIIGTVKEVQIKGA